MTFRKRFLRSPVWKWLLILTGIFYLLILLSLVAVDSIIFRPPPGTFETKSEDFLELTNSEGSKISAYYQAPEEGKPVYLWSHGNAEDLRSIHHTAKRFQTMGFGFMSYDYPGYGKTPGKPNEEGCYLAIRAAYDHLTKDLKIPPSRIILAGRSVGSGPTCWLASQVEHRGTLLISPFISTYRTVTVIPLFPGDRFPNIKHLPKMTQPLLIIHGTFDSVIPLWHSEKLLDHSAADQKELLKIEGADHNNLFEIGSQEIWTAIEQFTQEKE